MNIPTVTMEEILENIISEYYFTADQAVRSTGNTPKETSLSLMTMCVLVLSNGFVVTGMSACAHPEKFNEELGKTYAKADAIRQCWPLLGFRLRDKLHAERI